MNAYTPPDTVDLYSQAYAEQMRTALLQIVVGAVPDDDATDDPHDALTYGEIRAIAAKALLPPKAKETT
jgi:hypothetical protein